MAEKEMKKLNSEELKEVSGGEKYNDEKPTPIYHVGNWVRVNGYFKGEVTDRWLQSFYGPWIYRVFDGMRTSVCATEKEMEPWSKDRED